MELTWNVGEKRRGDILSTRDDLEIIEADVTFVVVGRHYNERDYDWKVKEQSGTTWGFCEEWGAHLVGDVPAVGQTRRMKIPHIHGDREVTVLVNKVYQGIMPPDLWGFGTCLDCDEPYHREPGSEWSLCDPSVLVTDFRQEQQKPTQQQPEQKETDMEIEKRKEWALGRKWDTHVPKADFPERPRITTVPGAVYVVGYSSAYRGVVLATSDTQCVVLAGSLDGYKVGASRSFGASGLCNKAVCLVEPDSTVVPLAWKKGELRFGAVRAGATNDSKVLHAAVAYTVVGSYGGTYDWEIELASGPEKGVRFGASEAWDSAVVPDVLRELRLSSFEPDPDAPTNRPDRFKTGEVYLARGDYAPQNVKTGMLMQVMRDSPDLYVVGVREDGGQSEHGYGIWEESRAHLQLMRLVGSAPKPIPKADQCGDKSTAYGLSCSMRKSHSGEKHRHGDAEWDVAPVVIKLGRCVTGHRDALGAAVMAVARVVVDTDGETNDLCAPCIDEREKRIAKNMRENDKEKPQPKYQPRYQVSSATLDAGGVINLRG